MAGSSEWLKDAEDDLASMRVLFQGRHSKHACFHAEQAAEKALKGLLLELRQPVPRTHDLVDLLCRVRAVAPAFPDHSRSATILSRYYGLLRYPDARPPTWTPPNETEAQEAVWWAEEIVRDVKTHLPSTT